MLTIVKNLNELSYSRNPIEVIVQLEADPEYTEDVYALCTVYNAASQPVTTLFARPDADYRVSFNVASIVNSILEFSLPNLESLSEINNTAVSGYWLDVLQYSAGEVVNGVPIGFNDEVIAFALKGGLSQEKIDLDMWSLIRKDAYFLTWLTQARVMRELPYYLYYLNLYDTEVLTAKAQVFYADGSSQTTALNSIGSVTKHGMVKLAAGFDQLSLGNLQPTKTPVYYNVWIENAEATKRAGHFKFTLSTNYAPFAYCLTYANSLGGFDFIHLQGNINKSVNPSNSELSQDTGSGERVITFNHLFEQSVKASTGFIKKRQMQALTDLFTSDQTFEIIDTRLIQVVISTKTKLEYDEQSNLYALQLEYTRSAKNQNFTPDDAN